MERYARAVTDGTVVAGPLVRAACARHLDDLIIGPARGLVWRADKARRAIGFYRDVLRLNGGEFEGLPFVLSPWQQFLVGSLFGWYGDDGYRRFRVAYCEIGKGNGKSPLAAGVGLSMMVADQEPRAEIYAAATKRDQAMILFRDAVAMRDQSPALEQRIKKIGGANPYHMYDERTASFFRAIASEDSQSGPRPHCGLIDELHEHPDSTVIEMMRAGTKGRRQALIFIITNSGFDRTSVCWNYHDYAARVCTRLVEDDSFFGFVCGLDEDDDWRDELVWPKANPNLGISITTKYLREQVREAIGMPSKQATVRRLNFCEWTEAESPWIEGDTWRACEMPPDPESLLGRPCLGALDLSGKNDLTALVLEFPDGTAPGVARAVPLFWAPADGIKEREERDRVPYRLWRDQGHLQVTPGRSIDYAFVAARVKELMRMYVLKELVFDRYRIEDFERELHDLGITTEIVALGKEPAGTGDLILRPHGQGFVDMGPAVDAIETGILNGTYKVDRNPVMTMCAANAVLTYDPAGNRKFDKRPGKSTGRIDGIVAAAMARRCAGIAAVAGKSFWE